MAGTSPAITGRDLVPTNNATKEKAPDNAGALNLAIADPQLQI